MPGMAPVVSVLPGQHDDHVAADARELGEHVAPRALAERRQRDDGGDTDRDTEQAERRAQAVPAQRARREAEHVESAHAPFSAADKISTASWIRLPGPR